MKRSVAIPLIYILAVVGFFVISRLSPLFAILSYGLTLPWSLFVGLIFPDQWIVIPIGIGMVINAAYLYGQLRSRE